MSKDIHIDDSSSLAIRGETGYDPVHIEIDGSQVEIRGTGEHPLYINALQNIAPIAAHIKEVNHIDPLSVESLFVSQVRNIEPLNIAKFNVTNLPLVNLALRQIPAVDLNVRRLPAISVGLHQVFDLPGSWASRCFASSCRAARESNRGSATAASRSGPTTAASRRSQPPEIPPSPPSG
jgi:hypothetical protein